MKVWVTADHHFGHANIIKHCNRPFATIAEHDEALIQNHNSFVDAGDVVYHLGDFSFSNPRIVGQILDRLNGRFRCLNGNHDRFNRASWLRNHPKIEWIRDYYELKLYGRKFVMFHYPLSSWNGMRRGSIHLHGHCHGNHKYSFPLSMIHGRRIDIGVDVMDYHPVPLEPTIIALADDLERKEYPDEGTNYSTRAVS